jgi:ABC-type transport system involved in multi-copper enzyme maturation permease subunit
MTRALQAELIKLRTTRTFLALTGSALALSLLVTILVAVLSNDVTARDVRDLFGSIDTSGLFILLLGIIGMAGEWRHRTIASTVLTTPQRLRLLLAKAVAYAIAGMVLSLVVNVVSMGVGSLILSSRNETTLPVSDLVDILWRNLVIAAFFGALGVLIGALLRNPAVAIVVILVFLFVVDPALLGLAYDEWKFGPFGGAPTGVTGVRPDDSKELLPLGAALAVMAGWLSLFFAAAAATFTKRDLV